MNEPPVPGASWRPPHAAPQPAPDPIAALPWLMVAGMLGAAVEIVLRAYGTLASPVWVTALDVALHGVGLGYIAYRFGRTASSKLSGGILGAAWGSLFSAVALEIWFPGAARWTGAVLRGALGALIPGIVDRAVNPWLLRGPLGRFASRDQRFSHLVR